MDIIYQLPFPKEVCNKIFMFACKSPHDGLGDVLLKHILGFNIYDKLVTNNGIVLNNNRNVVKFTNLLKDWLLNEEERDQLKLDIFYLNSLQNLTVIELFNARIYGDIVHLKSLPNLTTIWFEDVGIYGDISHLNMLQKLTKIILKNTGVFGDIANFKSLKNLNVINIYNRCPLRHVDVVNEIDIYGDISHLRLLLNLTEIKITNPNVYGDIKHLSSLLILKTIWLFTFGQP